MDMASTLYVHFIFLLNKQGRGTNVDMRVAWITVFCVHECQASEWINELQSGVDRRSEGMASVQPVMFTTGHSTIIIKRHCVTLYQRCQTVPIVMLSTCTFCSAFANSRKSAMSFVVSVYPSVPSMCPHVSARLPFDGFPWNLMQGTSTNICREISNYVTIGHCT